MAKLYYYYSAMNAGKSTTLLQSSFNYKERGMSTFLLTPAFDHRYEKGRITSRIGLSEEAYLYDHETDLLSSFQTAHAATTCHCVLVDEAQFLTKSQVWQLTEIADEMNVPVLCYGIRTDFQGELFSGSQWLLAWADTLTELKTICSCGRKATMVARIDHDGNILREGSQIEIGGNERYLSLCRRHFKQRIVQL